MYPPPTGQPLAAFDAEISRFLLDAGVPKESVRIETPARREFGERATSAALRLAREWRRAPRQIAEEIAAQFDASRYRFIRAVEPAGNGFLNFRLDYGTFAPFVIENVETAGPEFGRPTGAPARVVVEHTSVNPNKEWHVGHLRNAVLGDVATRLFRLAGRDVEVQNYIDDTGVQAAQAIFGLKAFPEEPRPGEKYDHYVGRAYVKVNAEIAAGPTLRKRLEDLQQQGEPEDSLELISVRTRIDNIERLNASIFRTMHALEAGDFHATIEEILNAQLLTAYRMGIYYDLLNWESHLVQSHLFALAIERLEQSPNVYRPQEGRYAGTLVIELPQAQDAADEPKREVLVRSNGIPTYVAKDIAYHIWKFGLVADRLGYVEYTTQPNGRSLASTTLQGHERPFTPPDQVINIIAVDQTLAQEGVKEGLRAGGFADAADRLVHLAYGLVRTEAGKFSGRKGGAPAADDLIDEAVAVALERVREKRSQELTDEDMQQIAEAVGIGAVRYFMVQYNPLRDIVFRVSDVVSYDGNTGLYVQYALVRMFAMLRRAREEQGITAGQIAAGDAHVLQHEQELRLLYHLAEFPEVVATAARTLSLNLIAEYAFDLATIFNQFYRDCGVLNAAPEVRAARLRLVRAVRDVLANACTVLGVPIIERL